MASEKTDLGDVKEKVEGSEDEEEGAKDKEEAERSYDELRSSILAVRILMVQCTMMLIITFVLVGYITMVFNASYILGAVLGLVGLILIFYASSKARGGSDVNNALGAALLFIGTGIGCTGSLELDNILPVMILMVFGPIAFAMYEMGSCIITIEMFLEQEGKDFAPVIDDMSEFLRENLRVMLLLVLASFLLSIMLMSFAAIGASALFANSLIIMGFLLGLVIIGASLLLLLKGGRMPRERPDGTLEPMGEMPGQGQRYIQPYGPYH
jgi:hypothetical protein